MPFRGARDAFAYEVTSDAGGLPNPRDYDREPDIDASPAAPAIEGVWKAGAGDPAPYQHAQHANAGSGERVARSRVSLQWTGDM